MGLIGMLLTIETDKIQFASKKVPKKITSGA
jgi:hypothetical protein